MIDSTFASHWADWKLLRGAVPHGGRQRRAFEQLRREVPVLLYYGDSWFSSPLYPNLAKQSSGRVGGIGMIAGKPGATAQEMLAKKAVDKLLDRIEAGHFDVLLLSLGGNDALSDRLGRVFPARERPSLSAREAFERVVDAGVLERVRSRYDLLLTALGNAQWVSRRGLRVLAHGYAPLVRIGEPAELTVENIGLAALFREGTGPWLYGPMKRVLANPQEARVFADLLLGEGFRGMVLEPLVQAHGGLFSRADFHGVEGMDRPGAWYDEIHPNPIGFSMLVPALHEALRPLLPAGKRALVT